jgi:hypothetical protein
MRGGRAAKEEDLGKKKGLDVRDDQVAVVLSTQNGIKCAVVHGCCHLLDGCNVAPWYGDKSD